MYPLLPFLFFPFPSPNQVEGDARSSQHGPTSSAGWHACVSSFIAKALQNINNEI
jgi:hypothetical protein